jgi:hypothetical protein
MNARRAVPFALLVVLSAAVFAQGPRRDGRWEVTMQMEMPGMPAGMPPFTAEQCVTKEQADDPQRAVPQQPGRGGAQSDCKTEDYKLTGNNATWTMRCTTPQPMTGSGEITYTENAYVGTMTMNMERGGQPMKMTMKMTGKRLGDCVEKK